MTIIIRSIFEEDDKFYPQLFLGDTLYELLGKCLQYEKIDVSEGIDVNKTSSSKECQLCHYWCFRHFGSKFEEHVCNGFHDLLTMAYSLENIAILNTKEATFRCIL